MKQYINNNFKLCLSTQIFMLFDLYIIKYDDNKDEVFANNLQNSFLNKNINLDDYILNDNVYVYKNIVSDLSNDLIINNYDINYKPINNIIIDTNESYEQIESNNTKTIFSIQIKKFDKVNYISSNMLFLNEEYLNSVNRNIKLDNYYEFLPDFKGKDNFLSNFYNVIG